MTRTTIYFGSSVILLIFLLAGYVFWCTEVENKQRTVQELYALVEAKTEENVKTPSLRSALTELSENEAVISDHTVRVDGIVTFLEELENLGRLFDAQVKVVSVSEAPENGEIALSVSITGSFDAVMRTLGVIEHGSYGSATKTLTLDTYDEGRWTGNAVFRVGALSTP